MGCCGVLLCAGQARVFAAVLSVLCAAVSLTSERGGLLSNCIVISVMKIDGTLIELANHHQQPGWHSQQPAHPTHSHHFSHTVLGVVSDSFLTKGFLAGAWPVLQSHFDTGCPAILMQLLSITEPNKYPTLKKFQKL